MKFTLFLSIAVLSAVQPALAQGCPEFDAAIEMSIKRAALTNVEGIGDDSAPRQTNRSLELVAEYQLIAINQSLAAANKCTVRKAPVQPNVYMKEALDCKLASVRREKDSPACDLKSWKGAK